MHGKVEGSQFEALFERQAIRSCMGVERIKNTVYVPRFGYFSVQAPFDYILVFKGKAVFVDTKTYQAEALYFSLLEPHQIKAIDKMRFHEMRSGYVVWFRSINKVVFFSSKLLNTLKQRESLHWRRGKSLGSMETMDLKKLFK